MTTTEIAQDGTVIWATLAEPGRGLAQALYRRRTSTAILAATLAALVSTAFVVPSLDMEKAAGGQLRPDMTPHEREEALATAAKLETVKQWASAVASPAVNAALLAVAFFLAFWLAGARTGFKDTLTVTAHAQLPIWLKALLTAPAAMAHAPVAPDDVGKLLPSSLAAFLPGSLPPAVIAAGGAIDVFTLWSAYLLGAGMAKASGASRRRAFVVTAILFVAYACLLKIVPSAAPAGGPGPHGGM